MCRWLAYSGSPVLLEDLLYKPQHSLVVQSLHSQLAVDPAYFAEIEGTTDSEMMLFLALTFGLEEDPPAAVARTVGLVAWRKVPESTGVVIRSGSEELVPSPPLMVRAR